MSGFKIQFAAAAVGAALLCAPAAASAAPAVAVNDALAQVLAGRLGGAIRQFFAYDPAAAEPGAWAMMLAGFGGAGALLRSRRGASYRLVEATADGGQYSEEFVAPDDATALARARAVAEGRIELWRGEVRIADANG
jgi:hypothetical protein